MRYFFQMRSLEMPWTLAIWATVSAFTVMGAANVAYCNDTWPYQSAVGKHTAESSIFISNLGRRMCALQSGQLLSAQYVAQIELGTESSWPYQMLLLTSAFTHAYTQDKRLVLNSSVPALSAPGEECKMATGCLFSSALLVPAAGAPPAASAKVWDRQQLLAHYLRGAGLLWLRKRTFNHTGCSMASAVLAFLLKPAGDFTEVVQAVESQFRILGGNVTVYNALSQTVTDNQLASAVSKDHLILVLGSPTQVVDLKQRLPQYQFQALAVDEQLQASVQTAVYAYAIAHSSHYIGGLDDMWVKVGVLLSMGIYNQMPRLTTGSSQWKDDLGFASCSAEEFRTEMRTLTEGTSIAEMLARPPRPKLPPLDFQSSRSGWSGRNSDPQLCKNITFPPPEQAISVDQLLKNGAAVQFDCTTEPCPKEAPFAPELRGTYAFNGEFTEEQRNGEYDGSAAHYRCGYMAPSGFDVIRDYQGFKQCRVVVVNVVARGRDVLLNTLNVAPHNLADPRVCFISIMDINGLITHQQELPEEGLMTYGNWKLVALLNSPWEGTTDGYWIRGARDANVMRHLRFRTFPEAEYSMWIDGKHQLVVDPCTLFDQLLNQNGKLMAAFNHENQRCVYREQEIIKGLAWTAELPGYREQIENVAERYHREGMPSEADGEAQGAYDLAIIISRHEQPANLHSCMAYSEIESFTSRNQLHYPYTLWRAKTKRFLYEAPNCAAWMYTRHVGHWSDHNGSF